MQSHFFFKIAVMWLFHVIIAFLRRLWLLCKTVYFSSVKKKIDKHLTSHQNESTSTSADLCICSVFRGSQNGSKRLSQWIKRKSACSNRDRSDIAHTQTPMGGGGDSDEAFWMSDPNRSLIALGTVKSCVHPFADEHTSQSLWLAREAPKWAISVHI